MDWGEEDVRGGGDGDGDGDGGGGTREKNRKTDFFLPADQSKGTHISFFGLVEKNKI